MPRERRTGAIPESPSGCCWTKGLKKRIEGLLKHEKWSPELISKRLAKDGEKCVSHETIYKWIWTAKHGNHRRHREYKGLHRHLRHQGRRQKRGNIKDNRGAITGRVGIGERPGIVEDRSRIGDIEVDLMMGENHRSALLVMTDRATPVTVIEKLGGKGADEVYGKMSDRPTNFSPSWIKTITFDNGKEFAHHHKIAKGPECQDLFHKAIYLTGQGHRGEQDRGDKEVFPQENRSWGNSGQTDKRNGKIAKLQTDQKV